jgi:hypothetical protein
MPGSTLSPALLSLRGRIGAYAVHAKYDSRSLTAAARAACQRP